jgi:starch phosphorylase
MLQALGCIGLLTFHLNEGHAALAPLELLRMEDQADGWDFRTVRNRTVFTTHTPVAAGHDQFDPVLAFRVLGNFVSREILEMLGGRDRVNMTSLALNLSHYVNGVAL